MRGAPNRGAQQIPMNVCLITFHIETQVRKHFIAAGYITTMIPYSCRPPRIRSPVDICPNLDFMIPEGSTEAAPLTSRGGIPRSTGVGTSRLFEWHSSCRPPRRLLRYCF